MAGKRRGNNEGSVFKRGDGRWCAVLDTPTGKKYFTGKKRAEVVARFDAAKADSAQGRLVGTGEQTVRDYLDGWVKSRTGLRFTSMTIYRTMLANLIPALGALRLCDLTPDHIDACYAELHGQYSGSTLRETHRIFKAALARAVQRDIIHKNPCDLVTPPRRAKAEIVCLDLSQVRQLITGSEGQPCRALWCLLVTTGLRSGEALGLQWDDIDFPGGTLTVRRQCQRVPGGLDLVALKSPSARRTVPVPQSILALLAEHRLYQPARSVSEVTALAVYTITETASQDGKVGGPPQVITLHPGIPAVELDAEAIQNVIQQNDERAQALRNSFYKEPGLSGDGDSRPDAD